MVNTSEFKRHGLDRGPLILRHEVNVPLRRPPIQVPNERRYLVPGLHSSAKESMSIRVVVYVLTGVKHVTPGALDAAAWTG